MIRIRSIVWLLAAAVIGLTAAQADDDWQYPYKKRVQAWAVSLYAGPSSTKYFGAVLQDFNLQSKEVLVGFALDRKIAYFGYDIYLAGEFQANYVFIGHHNTTFSTMLGFQAEKLLGYDRTSFSFYTGPSYALDPPYYSIGYKHRVYPAYRKKFINAIAIEFASGIPYTENWDWTVRLYHRSGVFGLYSDGDDDGLAVGLGLRYRF